MRSRVRADGHYICSALALVRCHLKPRSGAGDIHAQGGRVGEDLSDASRYRIEARAACGRASVPLPLQACRTVSLHCVALRDECLFWKISGTHVAGHRPVGTVPSAATELLGSTFLGLDSTRLGGMFAELRSGPDLGVVFVGVGSTDFGSSWLSL